MPEPIKKLILKLRLDNPTYGKAKLTVLLRRDHGVHYSESTIGRMLKKFMQEGRIISYHAQAVLHKKRTFKGHAKRLAYGSKDSIKNNLYKLL